MKFRNPLALRSTVDAAENEGKAHQEQLDALTRSAVELQIKTETALRKETLAVEDRDTMAARLRAAEDIVATMTEAHTTQWRIGSIRLDPEALTAQLRHVVPSVRVQQDRHLYVIYSDVQLSPGDLNRVKAELQSLLDMDRT